jgi:ribonuclease D
MNAHVMLTDGESVRALAGEVAAAGAFAFDVEFVSEGRCIPELSLVQLSWGDPEAPRTALIDCLAADPAPVIALIGEPGIESVAHAARQDLGLLRFRFGVRATNFWDTQIAAAFVGLGEQIGYGRLAEALLGLELDKGAQFTAWLKRPLTDRQIDYARADVLHLPAMWQSLRTRLERAGRLGWVAEESQRLAAIAEPLPDADEAWRDVGGARSLDPGGRGALRALAAWRQKLAVADNRPLGWILPDKAMLELARRRGGDAHRIRGIPEATLRQHGDELGQIARAGAAAPIRDDGERPQQLSPRAQAWAGVVTALVQSLGAEAEIAPRFLGNRADVEAFVAWFEAGADESKPPPLLVGWRRELAGAAALRWLRGETSIAAATSGAGAVRLVGGQGDGSDLQSRR